MGDFSFSDSGAQLALANAEYWWASARASVRIFGRAFYLALFLPLPRNFWRLESLAWIF